MRADALDGLLTEFYAKEQQRQVRFSPLAGDDAPYDIVLLHVCSLSWDDLDFVRDNADPLLHRFDILFDQFSSSASYSGPAAIRLLRANCGQVRATGAVRAAEEGVSVDRWPATGGIRAEVADES